MVRAAAPEAGTLTRTPRAPTRAAAAILAIAAIAGTAGAPSPASAWTDGPCPTDSGVTIVVDFTAFGEGTVTRCAPGSPRTGLDVLAGAGFTVEQVATMPGFVCRIDQRPGPSQQCQVTPPADASWSYWHAGRGGSWAYSPVGASGTRPAQGSVEGWSFTQHGSAVPPSVAPPPPPVAPSAPASPPPTARPTPPPAATPTTGPTADPTAGPTSAAVPSTTPAAAASAAPPTASAEKRPATTGAATLSNEAGRSPSPANAANPTWEPGQTATERPAPSAAGPGPGPLGTLVGVGIVAVTAAAALLVRGRKDPRDRSGG